MQTNHFLTIKSHLFIFFAFGITLLSCGKKKSSETPLPGISIAGVEQQRTTSDNVFKFKLTLDKAFSGTVSVTYSTLEGTALSNKDFIPASGTITIPANQLETTINVTVKADSLRTTNKYFYVQIDNPSNCTIKTNKAAGNIINENGTYFPVPNTGYTTPATYPGMTMVWSDEFNANQVNTSDWTFENGNNNGWGNNELEYYTGRLENVFQSAGNLIIEARQENFSGFAYTSTRMITKNKQKFKYGRIDIRAILPKGKGIWPALWMLGNNIDAVGWPACGEIDIMELLGQEPNKIYGTVHYGPTLATHASKGNSYVLSSGSFDQQFHVYSLVWAQDSVKILVDDIEYLSANASNIGSSYPFNSDFFFIFNVAVGGGWPGSPDGTTSFPQRMIVDYVRVFQ
ncbi:MAG: glycosyl hydrolase family protein [Sphingobacteriales bacterium]|nr:MAG: glycosyl hydrolase family protein [Sphingobacteriales bacterium]